MDWTKASDDQLWNIIENDWYVSNHLIKELVNEALTRNLFDYLIKHLINKYFNRWKTERQYHYYDLFQIGYIGIVRALNNYQVGKGSFKTFAYMNIKTEFLHHREKVNAEKRRVYENALSLDVQKHEDNEESFIDSLTDETQNPERIIVNKIFWSEHLSKLSQREKEVLIYFAQGYSFHEIAKMYGLIGAASVHRQFHRGIKKINPDAGKVNIKELGLMTMTKGA